MLSLNTEKKNSFVVFHSPQRRIAHNLNLSINISVISDKQIKYLGLIFDSNLNWKPYLHELSKKVSKGIGAQTKQQQKKTKEANYINYIIQLSITSSPMVYQFAVIPSSETQGQLVGTGKSSGEEKSRTRRRAPGDNVLTDQFQTVRPILASDWCQKTFVFLCPITEQHSLNFSRLLFSLILGRETSEGKRR